MNIRFWKWICGILIVLGVVGKFYDITAPWKARDHYNYGGVMTSVYSECIATTPLSFNKGIPLADCWTEKPAFYPNHPSTILFAIWGWTKIFGTSEAAHRLFILLFSALNIGLMFEIGRRARPDSAIFPWLVAAVHSITLGGLYFGTHLDFIGEFTITFILLSVIAALARRLTLSCLLVLVAGLTSWTGFIMFAPLLVYAWAIRKGVKRVIAFGAFGVLQALGMMMWLLQTANLKEFLELKLAHPGYVKKDQGGVLGPVFYAKNFVVSQARLMGPLLASTAFYELIRGRASSAFRGWGRTWTRESLTPYHHAILLAGGTGAVYAIIGHEYVMVHVFLYLLFTPALTLMAAQFFASRVEQPVAPQKNDKITFVVLALLFTALYPYGIYLSNRVHDALTSVAIILTSIVLMVWFCRRSFTARTLAVFLTLAFVCNLSEMINYRNEPDSERSFCQQARAEFEKTHQPVHTKEHETLAKTEYYCRNIPIIYEQ